MRQAEVRPLWEEMDSQRGNAAPAPGRADQVQTESQYGHAAAPSGTQDPAAERQPAERQPAERQPAETQPAETQPAETQPAETRRPGRPRSERAERAIIQAALELFAESGVSGVCVEAVAARAGVGKATIYRRWPGKEDLLFDALASLKSPLPEPVGVSVREDLVAMLNVMCQDIADPRRARQYALLLGEGEKHPKLMARYKETFVEPRRDMIRSVLRRGTASGELRPDVDIEIAMLTLTGAVIARGRNEIAPIRTGFAERLVDELLLGLAPR